MSNDQLSIDIHIENRGEAIIFRLRGSLDIATSPAVRAALLEAAGAGNHNIVVDLSKLEFLDSTGLGALIGAHRRALENDGNVRLVVSDGPIARLLNITGLIRILAVYQSIDNALHDRDRVIATS